MKICEENVTNLSLDISQPWLSCTNIKSSIFSFVRNHDFLLRQVDTLLLPGNSLLQLSEKLCFVLLTPSCRNKSSGIGSNRKENSEKRCQNVFNVFELCLAYYIPTNYNIDSETLFSHIDLSASIQSLINENASQITCTQSPCLIC